MYVKVISIKKYKYKFERVLKTKIPVEKKAIQCKILFKIVVYTFLTASYEKCLTSKLLKGEKLIRVTSLECQPRIFIINFSFTNYSKYLLIEQIPKVNKFGFKKILFRPYM